MDCSARSVNFNFVIPQTNLSVALNTSGDLPSVTAAGGYGDYEYTWNFKSGDLVDLFGSKATVTATDSKGCAASTDVTVPENTIVGTTPTANQPSSAAQLVGSLIGFAALFVSF